MAPKRSPQPKPALARLALVLALCLVLAARNILCTHADGDVGVGATTEETLVHVPGLGKIRGFREAGYVKFRGVPYAKPPTGDRRWRPPETVEPWHPKTIDATAFKSNCLQASPPSWYSIKDVRESSEDCLYLDLYTPDGFKTLSEGELRPTMVWIHGGDYQYGGSHDLENANPPPHELGRGTIFVTINYRLGAFGYLGSDHLRSRAEDGSTGNYGAQDQRAAIRWVHRHVSHFGGDPNRITIFGESAGAGSVTVQTVMQNSFGLFRRAITESGGFSQWVAKEMPRAEENYEFMMGVLGLNLTDVESLVHLPARRVLDATQYYYPYPWPDTMVQSQWAPTIDGVELLDHPSRLAAAGAVAPGVDIILGSNRDEGTMFVSDNNYTHKQGHYSGANLPRDLSESQFIDYSMGSWGPVVGRMIGEQDVYPLRCHRASAEYELCPEGTYNTWWWAATRATGDFMMTCTARRAARQWAAAGHSAFNFYFSHTPVWSVNTFPTSQWGAFHGSEVPFVWHAGFELTGPAEVALSSSMVRYWTNFASSGDPNVWQPHPSNLSRVSEGARLPSRWPRIRTLADDGSLRLATKRFVPYTEDFNQQNVTGVHGIRKRECDFWDRVNGFVVNPIPLRASWGGRSSFRTLLPPAPPLPSSLVRGRRSWQLLKESPMPTRRAQFAAVTIGNEIYALGGLTEDVTGPASAGVAWRDTNVVEIFDTVARVWKKAPPLLHPRSGIAAVEYRGDIYAIGGMFGGASEPNFFAVPYLEVLRGGTKAGELGAARRWKQLASMPQNRTNVAAAVLGSRIYICGGDGASRAAEARDTVWSYDPGSDSWRAEPSLPMPRTGMVAEAVAGYLYVFGGLRSFAAPSFDGDPLSTVDRYDPKTGQWTADLEIQLSDPRHSSASTLFTHQGKPRIVISGGYGRGDVAKVQMLDPQPGGGMPSWSSLPPLGIPRMMHALSSANGCLYAIGGMSSTVTTEAKQRTPLSRDVEVLCIDGSQPTAEL